MTPEEFTKNVIDERNQLMKQLLQLCAQDLQKELAGANGNPLNVLLTMRMQIEQLVLDIRTVTTSLIAVGALEPEKYAIALNHTIKERVKHLQNAQSKIVIVKR